MGMAHTARVFRHARCSAWSPVVNATQNLNGEAQGTKCLDRRAGRGSLHQGDQCQVSPLDREPNAAAVGVPHVNMVSTISRSNAAVHVQGLADQRMDRHGDHQMFRYVEERRILGGMLSVSTATSRRNSSTSTPFTTWPK